jgi:hypothetical protein
VWHAGYDEDVGLRSREDGGQNSTHGGGSIGGGGAARVAAAAAAAAAAAVVNDMDLAHHPGDGASSACLDHVDKGNDANAGGIAR